MRFIIGVGSHSEVVHSILKLNKTGDDIKFLGYPEVKDKTKLSELINIKYIGGLDEYLKSGTHSQQSDEFIIALGDNALRKEVAEKYPKLKYINAIHPQAIIIDESKSMKIGVGNVICPGVVIQVGVVIGNHNIINTNASIDHHGNIGNYCHLAPNTAICGNVTIHEGVFIGVGSSITPKTSIGPWEFHKAHSLITKSSAPIPMYEPYLNKYKTSMLDAIESGWVSSIGKYVGLATDKFKELLNAKHVLLVNNGTSATHCLFLALKFKYPNIKTIYVPNNVYVAVWNCALMVYPSSYLKVMKMNHETWNMNTDEKYISTLEKDSAVVVVHNLGNIVNIPRLKKLRPDLIFIEDSCEGLFGKYEGKYTGASDVTLCSSFSFFGNKTITSGEGGAITTLDKDVYDYLSKVCNQGNTSVRYVHDVLGYNYRMTNIQAALLYDQLNDINHILKMKSDVFKNYEKLLSESKSCKIQEVESGTERANWIFGVRLTATQSHNKSFDSMSKYMSSKGSDTRPMFHPIETHKHLSGIEYDKSESLKSHEIVMLPSSPTLQFQIQKHIIESLLSYHLSTK
ncbi:MAG: hypothetical protein Solumvirus4_17 [Solumvirus sp.]|uniref:PglD N-terminal domain-containing protein n=1 Tax=Solumvirus sp. TaxID=2487773 RepID=A0A3G5AKE8_9VIRU|nr:MAG: hypothetical protein Solumvirus4_17 [Solumvirus sp.]